MISLLALFDRVIGFIESRSGPAVIYAERQMTNATQTILVVDPNTHTRAILARQLASADCSVLEAADGISALQMLQDNEIGLVVSELYLKTGESDCLIQAIRQNRLRGTRTLAHTVYSKWLDRAWAKQWGASGYLIQPTRTKRLKYVVSKLLNPLAKRPAAKKLRISRRDTLDGALGEIERGELRGTSSIVFRSEWWSKLTVAQRNQYRQRAKGAGISLRSDSMMNEQFVELRAAAKPKRSAQPTAKPSPYRG